MAVEHLTASQMAYRDLKPENLAVRWDGYLVLIDLGLVADVSQEKSYTMCGTPVCNHRLRCYPTLLDNRTVSGVHGSGAN